MRQILLAACLALLAGGCVAVGSDEPLFEAKDAGGPPVRQGVWTLPNEKTCDYDPAKPVQDWPSCANAMVVGEATITGGFGDKDGPQALPYVLTSGEPAVLQLKAPPDKKPEEPSYIYFGLRPERLDDQGRVVEARVWMGLCFRPPLDAKDPEPKPFPGLVMKKGDSYCRAVRPGPVRNAIRRSEGVSFQDQDFQLRARWVREGDR